MKFDKLVSIIAGLGVPGLVLLFAMALTGYVGAAAITTALAALGGPAGKHFCIKLAHTDSSQGT